MAPLDDDSRWRGSRVPSRQIAVNPSPVRVSALQRKVSRRSTGSRSSSDAGAHTDKWTPASEQSPWVSDAFIQLLAAMNKPCLVFKKRLAVGNARVWTSNFIFKSLSALHVSEFVKERDAQQFKDRGAGEQCERLIRQQMVSLEPQNEDIKGIAARSSASLPPWPAGLYLGTTEEERQFLGQRLLRGRPTRPPTQQLWGGHVCRGLRAGQIQTDKDFVFCQRQSVRWDLESVFTCYLVSGAGWLAGWQ